MIYQFIIIFILSFYVLSFSGRLLIKSLTSISRYFGVSEYTVSFILVALGTSLPELFVGINSAISGLPNLSLGNIIGANIINATLLIGLIAIISRSVPLESETAKKDAWLTLALSILPIIFLADGEISRADGFVLMVGFFWYILHLIKTKERFEKKFNQVEHNIFNFRNVMKDLGLFVLGLALILSSGAAIVYGAKNISILFNLPLLFIGLIIVSVGTTVPEFVFGFKSVVSKHSNMALGNAIGSIAVNSSFILGLVSIISPIKTNFQIGFNSMIFMVFSVLLFTVFIRTKDKITWKEGIVLVLLYILFVIIEILSG